MTAPLDMSAQATYDAYATAYDDFNHRYMYERWTGRLLGKAEEAGLSGDRLLDVGCGTGLSFISMLDRGWKVTACDISGAMLDRARVRALGRATLVHTDMRALPVLGEFDLVWAVNDAMNYILRTSELESTLAGMRGNLAEAGLVLFDMNTLATYRSFFSGEFVVERSGRRMMWNGRMAGHDVVPGGLNEAVFEVEGDPQSGHVHRQRHFSETEVLEAIENAGLRSLGVWGELDGALLDALDEEVHTKAVYVIAAA